jgi:hypothetical protein
MSSIDTTPDCLKPPQRLIDQAARDLPAVMADMPAETRFGAPAFGRGEWVVFAENLAGELAGKRNHLRAAAAWAIHDLIREGLLVAGIGVHVASQVIAFGPRRNPYPLYSREHWDLKRNRPRLEEVARLGPEDGTPLHSGPGPVPYKCLLVRATPALWQRWQESLQTPAGAATPPATAPPAIHPPAATNPTGEVGPAVTPAPAGKAPRVKKADRERRVSAALNKLTGAKTKVAHDQKREAVRLEDVMKVAGLPKSSAASTDAWKEFQTKRQTDGLSPKQVGRTRPVACPLTDVLLDSITDPKADDPKHAVTDTNLSADEVWDSILQSAESSAHREQLTNLSHAERRELIDAFCSQQEDQRRDEAPRRSRPS